MPSTVSSIGWPAPMAREQDDRGSDADDVLEHRPADQQVLGLAVASCAAGCA